MRAFITFEGIEGSGKTTQIQLLSEKLEQKGIDHVLTREPGGTAIGNDIRRILLNPEHRELTPLAELLLYQAARAQHLTHVILPALQEGKLVLCDRYKDATRAYQGHGRELPAEIVDVLNQLDVLAQEPDLTLLFDLDPQVALARARNRHDTGETRFEEETLSFHIRVREAYLNLARTFPERVQLVPAEGTRAEVQARVLERVSFFFPDLSLRR